MFNLAIYYISPLILCIIICLILKTNNEEYTLAYGMATIPGLNILCLIILIVCLIIDFANYGIEEIKCSTLTKEKMKIREIKGGYELIYNYPNLNKYYRKVISYPNTHVLIKFKLKVLKMIDKEIKEKNKKQALMNAINNL